jgi:hypothetical protein
VRSGPGETRTILLLLMKELTPRLRTTAATIGMFTMEDTHPENDVRCIKLCRGCLLTTGHLSSRHPVVVGTVRVMGGFSGGAGEGVSILRVMPVAVGVLVSSSVDHL